MEGLEHQSRINTHHLSSTRRQSLHHVPITELLMLTRNWIEECTELINEDQTFLEYLNDGTVLCKLIQAIHPGLIKRTNRIRSPFAWRENILFFLEACRKLGLKESQLFAPEDLYQESFSRRTNHKLKGNSQEKRLRKVCEPLYNLGLKVTDLPDYSGPTLEPASLTQATRKVPITKKDHNKEFLSTQNLLSLVSQSRYGARRSPSGLRKVQSVVNLITETTSTDEQSFAEVVLYLNKNKSNSHSGVRHTCSVEAFSTIDLSEGEASAGNKKLSRTSSGGSPRSESEVFHKAASLQCLSLSPRGIASPVSNSSTLVTPSDHREFDFSTSPSEASTVIHRDNLASPLSSISDSRVVSANSSPTEQSTDKFNSLSPLSCSQPSAEDDIFLNNPFSPVQLSNVPVESPIDQTGIITALNHKCTHSQDTFSGFYPSPEREASYHISLTQKSEDQSPGASQLHRDSHQNQLFETSTSSVNLDKSSDTLSSVPEGPSRVVQTASSTVSVSDNSPISSVNIHPIMTTAVEGHYSSGTNSEPVQIPDFKPQNDVPHHSLNVVMSGPDSPSSSYQVSHADFRPACWTEHEVDISLHPGEERLGLNLAEHPDNDVLLRVKAIGPDSAAARSDVRCGDEILAVNDIPLQHTALNIALHILQETMSAGKFVLRVRREENRATNVPHYKTIRPPDLLDMSRVSSDALPHSLNAKRVQLFTDRSKSNTPEFLNSELVEITDDLTTYIPETEQNGQTRDNPMQAINDTENSVEPVPTEDLPLTYRVKNPRPISAPTKSLSSTVMSPNKANTLPSKKSSSNSKITQERQALLNKERENRMNSIQANAQILLKYSQNRKCSQTGSLPRDYRSLSQLGKLFELGDGLSNHDKKSPVRTSSPELSHSRESSSSVSTAIDEDSSASTPLNLRHISMDETRIASLMYMDNIWRQVESGDDSPNPGENKNNIDPVISDSYEPSSEEVSIAKDIRVEDSSDVDGSLEEPVVPPSPDDVIRGADIVLSLPEPQSCSTPFTSSFSAVASQSLLVPPDPHTPEIRERTTSFSNKDIDSLLSTLKSLSAPEEDVDDLKVLEDMLKSNTFKKAKKVHDQMHHLLSGVPNEPQPVVRRIVPSTQLMRQELRCGSEQQSQEVDELRGLLRKPHVQALLFCHDKVSTCDLYVPDTHFHNSAHDPVDIILSGSVCHFQPAAQPTDSSIPLSRDVPNSRKEGAVIVFIDRTHKPLGVTVYKQEESVYVGKLMRGCDAETSNVLREGDELLEVNGIPVWGKTTDNIVGLLSEDTQEGDVLVLTIIPLHDDNIDLEYETKYIRAHFNYNGRLDEEIPCKAVGLAFQKGDILEISNQDDPNWWQARKVFDDGAESLPGLVPSRHLQQQREAMVRSYPFSISATKKKGFGSIFSKKKKKKVFYQSTSTSSSFGVGDEVPTYEEVVRLTPNQSPCRPLILIGAPGVGRRALIRELINSDPSRFSCVVPHTSRNARPGEVEGRDYYFVTREEFESDMHRDRFLEYGDFKGLYYGTSFTSIKKIMESSRVPVLDVHPQALKKLRYSGLQPYVIFIASPRLERLQFTRKTVSEKMKRSFNGSSSHLSSDDQATYTENELKQMLEESLLIENQYGHYFDWIIVNDDFQVASDMLKEVVRRVEDEPQWVPVLWKYDKYN